MTRSDGARSEAEQRALVEAWASAPRIAPGPRWPAGWSIAFGLAQDLGWSGPLSEALASASGPASGQSARVRLRPLDPPESAFERESGRESASGIES